MASTKQLYADGKFVCDYESTGDDAQDALICTAILKDKGLHRETSIEQAIFRQAAAFATTSAYLYTRDMQVTGPATPLSVVPFVVNATFALELYLKALALLHGVHLRGHDLLSLFDDLPPDAHRACSKTSRPANISAASKSYRTIVRCWPTSGGRSSSGAIYTRGKALRR
jgi:hypothetical protein